MNEERDPWDLVPRDDLPSLTLDQLLARVGRLAPESDGEGVLISIRVAPVGYRAVMAQLAREHRISFSRLALLTAVHGTAMLEVDPRIQMLRHSYETTRSEAMAKISSFS